jgi:hypothetical protein
MRTQVPYVKSEQTKPAGRSPKWRDPEGARLRSKRKTWFKKLTADSRQNVKLSLRE